MFDNDNRKSYISEGTAGAGTTLNIGFSSNLIEIINDGTVDLEFKFKTADTYATIKAKESFTVPYETTTIILNGTEAYRVRAYGS